MHKLTVFLVVVACSWYGQAVMDDPNVTPSSSLVPPKLGTLKNLLKPIILNPLETPRTADALARIAAILSHEPQAAVDPKEDAPEDDGAAMDDGCDADDCKKAADAAGDDKAIQAMISEVPDKNFERDVTGGPTEKLDDMSRRYRRKEAQQNEELKHGHVYRSAKDLEQDELKAQIERIQKEEDEDDKKDEAIMSESGGESSGSSGSSSGSGSANKEIEQLEKLIDHARQIEAAIPAKEARLFQLKAEQERAVEEKAKKQAGATLQEHQHLMDEMARHIDMLAGKLDELKKKKDELATSDARLKTSLSASSSSSGSGSSSSSSGSSSSGSSSSGSSSGSKLFYI